MGTTGAIDKVPVAALTTAGTDPLRVIEETALTADSRRLDAGGTELTLHWRMSATTRATRRAPSCDP